MDNKEAIRRILDHQRVHSLSEPRDVLINEALDLAIDALREQRQKGEWIDTGSGQECNVCHEIQYGYDNFRHFCANCGADMRNGG